MIVKNCELKSAQVNQSNFQTNNECLSLLTFGKQILKIFLWYFITFIYFKGIKLNENKHTVCKNELIAFCNQVNLFFLTQSSL